MSLHAHVLQTTRVGYRTEAFRGSKVRDAVKVLEYEEVVFSKVVANMVIDTGTMRLDRIKEIL